jgi:hypothetical protein
MLQFNGDISESTQGSEPLTPMDLPTAFADMITSVLPPLHVAAIAFPVMALRTRCFLVSVGFEFAPEE